MKLLPLIVGSIIVVSASSSYAECGGAGEDDVVEKNCEATPSKSATSTPSYVNNTCDEKLGRMEGELKGSQMMISQLREENERLKEQNKKLLDLALKNK